MTQPIVPAFADPIEAANYAQYKAAQEEEYNTYIASEDIPYGNCLAFLAGQAVPKSTVEREGWHDRVIPVGLTREEWIQQRMAHLRKESAELEAELASRDKPAEITPPPTTKAARPPSAKTKEVGE